MTTYTTPDLAYAYDALEPTIDKETMHLHHDKHHVGYTSNLNKALEGLDVKAETIEELLEDLDQVPAEKRQAIINNGGGHYNHTLFWESMTPGGANQPQGELAKAIDKAFGSFDEFKEAFQTKGATQFGSGWAWLVLENGELKVTSTANQENPISNGATPLLGNDVWEHAYYLNYKNARPDYLKAWWKVVNWDVVAERYAAAK
ncbi:MAG TPA: superoxide dismutase [Candidatus Eisenbacteria bacterium]|nr:superoxide dismutase [Candidatus Eisenbacteria bacterium]